MSQTLNGLRILNTRPQNSAVTLNQEILSQGGMVVDCPTLEIEAMPDDWIKQLSSLPTVHAALFISANAVEKTLSTLKRHKISWPASIKIIAIGTATAKALEQYNLHPTALPAKPDSEHILKLDNLQNIHQKSVLLFKGVGGRPLIENELTRRGAKLTILEVYKRTLPKIEQTYIDSIWHNDMVDIILITSEQALEHLFILFNKKAHDWLKNKTFIVLSERLAKRASQYGVNKIYLSHPNKMVQTLNDYYQGLTHDQ